MLPSLCWLAFPLSVLASSSSRVLVFDTDRKAPSDRTQPDRVSGRAAQNFISHRLGLDRFQTIEEDDVDSTISLISRFGGSVQKPFGPSDKRVEPVKALIIIESVESPETFLSSPPSARFDISDSDTSSVITPDFLQSLESTAHSVYGDSKASAFVRSEIVNQINTEFWGRPDVIFSREDVTLAYVTDLSVAKAEAGAGSGKATQTADRLKRSMERIIDTVSREQSYLTVVLMSGTVPTKGDNKGSNRDISSINNARKSQSKDADVTELDDKDTASKPKKGKDKNKNKKKLPLGSIPACFNSAESCQTGTNNCSSHGECVASSPSCYTCACKPSVRSGSVGSGQSTTYFAGRACQKRDVSTQFWIIAIFSVLFVAAISSGIGMLYSMGDEKLPANIAAGIPPPKH